MLKYTISIEQNKDGSSGTMLVHTEDGHELQVSADGDTLEEVYDALDEGLDDCLNELKKSLEEATEEPEEEKEEDDLEEVKEEDDLLKGDLVKEYKQLEAKYNKLCDAYAELLYDYRKARDRGFYSWPFWL